MNRPFWLLLTGDHQRPARSAAAGESGGVRRDRAQPIRQVDDAPAAVPNGRDGRRLRARAKLPQLGYVLEKNPAPTSSSSSPLFPAPRLGGPDSFSCVVCFFLFFVSSTFGFLVFLTHFFSCTCASLDSMPCPYFEIQQCGHRSVGAGSKGVETVRETHPGVLGEKLYILTSYGLDLVSDHFFFLQYG